MTKKQAAIVKWRQRGYSYAKLASKLDTTMGYIAKTLGRAGLVKPYRKAKAVRTVTATTTANAVTVKAAPSGLNGLTKVWNKAEQLIDRAKRIKAAVKELNKALHS